MPRIVTTTKTVFSFDELSDSAKETARQWLRDCSDDGVLNVSSVIHDFAVCCDILGVTINEKHNSNSLPLWGNYAVYWSGFACQGDGACFESSYAYSKGWRKKLLAHAPKDAELLRIGQGLQDAQKPFLYKIKGKTKHDDNRYYHAGTMDFSAEYELDETRDILAVEAQIQNYMRALANWLYKQLEAESDYQNSDEVIDENIRANEYEFLESGKRYI